MVNGTTFGYSLYNLSSRGTMIVDPSTDVYIGMIIGISNKEGDLDVNPCKNKELTNTRSAHADEAIVLNKAKKFTLEEALEFISQIAHVKITKSDVAKYLNVSERTVDRRELSGEIPPSYKQPVSKKVWFLDEILKHKNLLALG